SNLSKSNLEDICRSLELLTEDVKVDLVQRLKLHSTDRILKIGTAELVDDEYDRVYNKNKNIDRVDMGNKHINDLDICKENFRTQA
ncbi:10456_t:CDS:1, partial [Dentiscutata erythropus]